MPDTRLHGHVVEEAADVADCNKTKSFIPFRLIKEILHHEKTEAQLQDEYQHGFLEDAFVSHPPLIKINFNLSIKVSKELFFVHLKHL